MGFGTAVLSPRYGAGLLLANTPSGLQILRAPENSRLEIGDIIAAGRNGQDTMKCVGICCCCCWGCRGKRGSRTSTKGLLW